MDISKQARQLKKAQDWISKAELILVIGANGSYGNAYFNYRKRGSKIIQINPSGTNFDSYASINIHAGADEVFRLVMGDYENVDTK